jgi:type II secretory ATPase GspE/PulE/Tfp pilus assembly ATPase PilB-like protein
MRIDGGLTLWRKVTSEQLKAMITRLKFIANMDVGESRLPQDGSLELMYEQENIQLRLATIPSVYGEKMVIRLFPLSHNTLTLAQLGFTPKQLQELHRIINLPHGLFLITGPTGSGKTTTMYKILEELAKDSTRNICSLEDPVEMRMPALTQVQVNPRAGLSFASGLRALLRQDPDVIFVGEIRDEETAEIAVRAALTGHLVLSTLHTFDTVGAVVRLLEMGIKPYYLASCLIAVIAQRLFRLCCPFCRGKKCFACFYTGYLGRRGVFELLPVWPKLKKAIQEGSHEGKLQQVTREMKMATIGRQLLRYHAIGLTTLDECLPYLWAERYFKQGAIESGEADE